MKVDIYSKVHHSLYGQGEVIKITGKKIYVSFGNKQRIFNYPKAFDKGYVSIVVSNSRENVLDAADNICYEKIHEAINAVVGANYTGWMKATWPKWNSQLPFRIWFPKLAETKGGELFPAANNCLNTISDDWNEFVFDNMQDTTDEFDTDSYTGVTLIFAKEPKGGPYIFRGVFIENKEKTYYKHHILDRIGTKVKLLGQPADKVIILDDFRHKE